MTTAGRPTWNTARGTKGKWEKDLSAMSKQYSVRDLPAHTKLKTRQAGQGRPEDLNGVDFKKELEEKEQRLAAEKSHNKTKRNLAITSSKQPTIKKSKDISTANLDADDPWEEDYEEDIKETEKEDAQENSEDSDSDEDEELLLAELNKIKKERAEEAAKLAERTKAEEETIRLENIVKGNPLLNNDNTFKVKKKWDDDVVFKNCARGAVDHSKRGYVNNMLRSDFHRKFMKKYIQ